MLWKRTITPPSSMLNSMTRRRMGDVFGAGFALLAGIPMGTSNASVAAATIARPTDRRHIPVFSMSSASIATAERAG